ncbi:MAG: hypothetical protein FKGGLIKP_00310 [Sodalis sp. Fse]|nr:MAG: hypothetical protein FKGGLIKP_00310 [Sodalis sp. Fse]
MVVVRNAWPSCTVWLENGILAHLTIIGMAF